MARASLHSRRSLLRVHVPPERRSTSALRGGSTSKALYCTPAPHTSPPMLASARSSPGGGGVRQSPLLAKGLPVAVSRHSPPPEDAHVCPSTKASARPWPSGRIAGHFLLVRP